MRLMVVSFIGCLVVPVRRQTTSPPRARWFATAR